MKIAHRLVDDLKTERPDVSPGLPGYLRIVPVLFFAFVIGGAALAGYFLLQLRAAAAAEAHWKSEDARLKAELTAVQDDRQSVEKTARRANDIAGWIEGSRAVQPLVVGIIRSMEPSSAIAELALSRDPATPAQLKLVLKLNTTSARQLDATLQEITARSFRSYSPNQTQGRGQIDYETTLIHQGQRASATLPEPAASPAPSQAAVTP